MSESLLGEVRIFGGDFAPAGWAFCDGQLLPISEHTALFSLLGTTFGGDGRTTFGLPDLRGRIPVGTNSLDPGIRKDVGSKAGHETVKLSISNLPKHNHSMQGSSNPATATSPENALVATVEGVFYEPETEGNRLQAFPNGTISFAGEGQAHENRMATIAVNYIISLTGHYPERN